MFEKILVCLDGSSDSERALPFAIDEARCRGTELVLVRVNELTRFLPVWASGAPQQVVFIPPAMLREEMDKEADEQKAYVADIADRLRNEGVPATSVLLTALPSEVPETIVDYASNNGIGLIVMATKGRRWWRRVFTGSVAAAVAKQSGIPVLVIWKAGPATSANSDRASDYDMAAGEPVSS